MFSREDWTIFRNLSTITHKAGVPVEKLRRLVIKELADNALDANPGEGCSVAKIDEDSYQIIDTGAGIPGSAEDIAKLFSIRRPLTSSKILRMPSRGALGNGLRVVAGVLLASDGELEVSTSGKKIKIQLNDDGTSTPVEVTPAENRKGTIVTVRFGKSVPRDKNALLWAQLANGLEQGLIYRGKSSPWWYDSDSFYELMMAASNIEVKRIVRNFDGVSDRNVDNILGHLKGANAGDLDRDMCDDLMDLLRTDLPHVSPKEIGRVADKADEHDAYHRQFGTVEIAPGRGRHSAVLPYCIEAISKAYPVGEEPEDDLLLPYVNNTPITGDMHIERRGKTEIGMFGCGVRAKITRVSRRKFIMKLNITIPYMPITTDGKAPDFGKFFGDISEVTRRSTRRLKSLVTKGVEQTRVITKNMDAAIRKASGNSKYRFSLRQLYYAVRPYVMEQNTETGVLDYTYFAGVISRYENEHGEIQGMYRDPRGVIYHPHTGETIPVGTISVESYERPKWTFRNVLYIEKEGLFEVLKQDGFPERYDCALMSSKGFASRAVRDLIDLLGEHDEEVNVFCIHDADGPGTVIYQALVEGTVARAARKIKVINLGLEPWEGLEMGLQVENFGERKSKVPTADYVDRKWTGEHLSKEVPQPCDFDLNNDNWSSWLQTQRVELNAMTSPQFLEWINGKFEALGVKKVMPPPDTVEKIFVETAQSTLRSQMISDILNGAGFEEKFQKAAKGIAVPTPEALDKIVTSGIKNNPGQLWSDPVQKYAKKIIAGKD